MMLKKTREGSRSRSRSIKDVNSYQNIDPIKNGWSLVKSYGSSEYLSIKTQNQEYPIFNIFEKDEWCDIEFGPRIDDVLPIFQIRLNQSQLLCMRSINAWLLMQMGLISEKCLGISCDTSFHLRYRNPLIESNGRWPNKLIIQVKTTGSERLKTILKENNEVINSNETYLKTKRNWRNFQIRPTIRCDTIKIFESKSGTKMFALNLIASRIEIREKVDNM